MDLCKMLKEAMEESSDEMKSIVVRIEEAKSGRGNAKRREDISKRMQDDDSVEAEIENVQERYLEARSKLIRSTLTSIQSFNKEWLEVRCHSLKLESEGFLELDRNLDVDKKRLEAMHNDLVHSSSSRNHNEPSAQDFENLSDLTSKVSAATAQIKPLEQDYREIESRLHQAREEQSRVHEALKKSGSLLITARRLVRAGHCHLKSVNSAMTKEIATESESTRLEDKLIQMQDEASLNSAILCKLQVTKKTLMEERSVLIAEIASVSKKIEESLKKECRDVQVSASARDIDWDSEKYYAETVAAEIVRDILSLTLEKLV